MIKFTTDILGAQILLFQEHATLGPVIRLLFSPDNGDVIAFFAHDPIQKKEVVLLPRNVKKMVGDIIIADGYDSLADPNDVIRVSEAQAEGIVIIKAKVITESGTYLGRVAAASVDTTYWKLQRLYVNPPLGLKFLAKELLIPAKKIVKIEKNRIIVTDNYARIKGIKPVATTSAVLD